MFGFITLLVELMSCLIVPLLYVFKYVFCFCYDCVVVYLLWLLFVGFYVLIVCFCFCHMFGFCSYCFVEFVSLLFACAVLRVCLIFVVMLGLLFICCCCLLVWLLFLSLACLSAD